MFKKILKLTCIVFFALVSAILGSVSAETHTQKRFKIGILMPMEHKALQEVIAGFKETVNAHFPNGVEFDVQSAQGDIKLQRSIIELFVGRKVDIIVPIGTSATQMTISLVKDQPIVGLAAQFTESQRQKLTPKNMTNILDEIGGKKKIEFIKTLMPELKTITVVFQGGNEKNFQEVEELTREGKAKGIEVISVMVQNMADLETAGKSISEKSEAILILKDHLIASGIRLLIPIAKARHIPLITSDEGTIQEGGTLALGVKERAIGEEGGALAIQILEGKPIAELPVQEMKSLSVFYNMQALENSKVKEADIQKAAKKYHYSVYLTPLPGV